MNDVEAVPEDEFISSFLAGEFSSARFGDALHALIRQEGWPLSLVTNPQLGDPRECERRRHLLGLHRGFGLNLKLFESFPSGVAWSRCRITQSELWSVLYMDYSYWNVLSGGSRLPLAATTRIRDGVTAYGVDNDGFIAAAAAWREGAQFPKLILVRADPLSPLVVLEGHVRLTAYALVPDYTPAEMLVMVGEDSSVARWDGY